MTTCPVHAVKLPGCPHANPAGTYAASQRTRPSLDRQNHAARMSDASKEA